MILNELIENLSLKVPNNLYKPEIFIKVKNLKIQNQPDQNLTSVRVDKVTIKYKDYIEAIAKYNKDLPCLKDITNFETLIDIYGFIERDEYKNGLDVSSENLLKILNI